MEQVHHQVGGGFVQPPPPQFTAPTDVHPNATASHLPSYAEMITAAIVWDSSQGKAGGSSKRAIAKYIDRVYTNLPPTHSSLLAHHLKRMKNSGQLVMIKNSYQLPLLAATSGAVNSGDSTAAVLGSVEVENQLSETPKKRPGRPPKLKHEAQAQGQPEFSNGVSGTGKRPRGRPSRKQQEYQQQLVVAEVPFVQTQTQTQAQSELLNVGVSNDGQSQTVKRRPGRPAKKQDQAQAQQQDPAQFQVVVSPPVNGGVVKRRPGRPSKLGNVVPQSGGAVKRRGRGRPKRSGLGPIARPVGKKPRGRPPRVPGAGPGSGVTVSGGKRRGRPPKGSVVPPPKAFKKPYNSKPRGRPKKSASTLGKPTPDHRMADEELIKKVENMQATIRDAVGILKPYFLNENATDEALTALQLLEDLSTVKPPATDMPLNNSTTQPFPAVPSEAVHAPAPPTTTIPAPQAAEQPPVVPFSISAPEMTDAAPFYMPPNVGTQPTSWIPSGEA